MPDVTPLFEGFDVAPATCMDPDYVPPPVTATCDRCDGVFVAGVDGGDDDVASIETHGVCTSCVYSCESCEDSFRGHDATWWFSETYCQTCADSYATCESCDEPTHVDDMVSVHLAGHRHSQEMCSLCAERYWYCDFCEYFHNEYEDCPEDSGEDDDSGAYDDGRGREEIHSYSYKPVPVFRYMRNGVPDMRFSVEPSGPYDNEKNPRHMVFMGFELECESRGNRVGNGVSVMAPWTSNEIAYLKNDSSIASGMEIVSHPATLDYYHQLNMAPLQELRNLGWRSWDTDTCGIHIHVSRNAFQGKAHIWRFARLILANEVRSTRLAGRRGSSWCAFGKREQTQIHRNLTKGEWSDRYLAVNLQNDHTVEVRMFKGSLNSDRLLMDLEFIDAVVEYTRNMALGEIRNGALEWRNFATWVQVNGKRYPHLLTQVHIESDDVMYAVDNA